MTSGPITSWQIDGKAMETVRDFLGSKITADGDCSHEIKTHLLLGRIPTSRHNDYFLLLFSHSVVSDYLQPRGLQHARLPCTSLFPGVCSNSCPLSQWCHTTISSSVSPFFFCPQSFPASRSLPMSTLRIRWPKDWSFHISPSNEYSGLISFRIDWFDLLAVQGILRSLLHPAPQFKSINSLAFSLPYGSTLTSVHDYWKNPSFAI